jgi:class 3 adenylate cyclase
MESMPYIKDPDRRVLIAVDMESYSGRDNVLQHRAQLAFREVMTTACDELGLDRANWQIQQGGDGELAILPQGTSERAILARLTPVLDRLLRETNRGLSSGARIRLRVGVHEGPVHLDGANGYPGEAVVTVCRLVDSTQLKQALKQFPEAAVALIVSDRLFQDIVRQYQDLRPDHFHQVTARVPDKGFEAAAWIYVPGERIPATGTRPDLPDSVPDPPDDGPGGSTVGHRRSGPRPRPTGGGQVFRDNQIGGVGAIGTGNSVSVSGRPEDLGFWESPR